LIAVVEAAVVGKVEVSQLTHSAISTQDNPARWLDSVADDIGYLRESR
jgi:hypothetical protein